MIQLYTCSAVPPQAANENYDPSNPPCWLYIIGKPEGPIKIGISSNPEKRLAQIQTSCPIKVRLLFKQALISRQVARDRERGLHDTFECFGRCGEWIDVDAWLVARTIMLVNVLRPEEYVLDHPDTIRKRANGEWS